MLRNINPLLNGEVLLALREMGHADQVVVVDANYPAAKSALSSVHGELLRIDASVPDVLEAILSLMPLDGFIDHPLMHMAVVGDHEKLEEVHKEGIAAAQKSTGDADLKSLPVERFEFYDMASKAFCVIATSERRFYGDFILQKGVIAPDE